MVSEIKGISRAYARPCSGFRSCGPTGFAFVYGSASARPKRAAAGFMLHPVRRPLCGKCYQIVASEVLNGNLAACHSNRQFPAKLARDRLPSCYRQKVADRALGFRWPT
jgi:hypothetical protein